MKKAHVSWGLVIWFRPHIITGRRTDDATPGLPPAACSPTLLGPDSRL